MSHLCDCGDLHPAFQGKGYVLMRKVIEPVLLLFYAVFALYFIKIMITFGLSFVKNIIFFGLSFIISYLCIGFH